MKPYQGIISTQFLTASDSNDGCSACYRRSKTEHQQEEPKSKENWFNGRESFVEEEKDKLPDKSLSFDSLSKQTASASPSAEVDFTNIKLICDYDDAPDHLKFNPYIRRGYRTFLSNQLCLQSIFWWTNETINIWSHLVGCIIFMGLIIFDFQFLKTHAAWTDQMVIVSLLVCFCFCMLFSTIYHIFSCCSEEQCKIFLSFDLLGVSLSLIAIYISCIYYAFWCFKMFRIIYSVIALGMFALAVVFQIPKLNISMNAKMTVLLLWSAYGIIPLTHWTVAMGGLQHELVQLMLPRFFLMYLLCLIAFVVYASRIPERWLTGKVDFFGHSHNWWHLIILTAFYHWYGTGIVYAEYHLNNACPVSKFAFHSDMKFTNLTFN